MSQLLKPGQVVRVEASGLDCIVEQFLGDGGQGEVYSVDVGQTRMALKWYFRPAATADQRAALEVLVRRGAPSTKFLWPVAIVSSPSVEGFGYLMPLRPPRFHSIVDLMRRRVAPTFGRLATAGYVLADSYYQLHARGLCYRDISFGNVFFNPTDGDILICDNDNVAINGESRTGVLGTARFMAPEVVTGRAMPSTQTDLFSLSVLLFYMLMVAHPLDGKKEAAIRSLDSPAMRHLYGDEPLFIYHPTNHANRPVPGLHDNAIVYWGLYPRYLRTLFTRAFVDGIESPEHGRVRENEWRAAMIELRDCIVDCNGCGIENFRDMEPQVSPSGVPSCWSCKGEIRFPYYISMNAGGRNGATVMLNRSTQLFPHHLGHSYDFSGPVASVLRHPTDPKVWGLTNLSTAKWTAVTRKGEFKEVPPGRSVSLAVGTRIQFGSTEGEIGI